MQSITLPRIAHISDKVELYNPDSTRARFAAQRACLADSSGPVNEHTGGREEPTEGMSREFRPLASLCCKPNDTTVCSSRALGMIPRN